MINALFWIALASQRKCHGSMMSDDKTRRRGVLPHIDLGANLPMLCDEGRKTFCKLQHIMNELENEVLG